MQGGPLLLDAAERRWLLVLDDEAAQVLHAAKSLDHRREPVGIDVDRHHRAVETLRGQQAVDALRSPDMVDRIGQDAESKARSRGMSWQGLLASSTV